MNIIQENMKIPANYYAGLVKKHYTENKSTSPTHIDALVILYKLTREQKVFNLIFECHYFLLLKILREKYNKFRGFLYDEDYDDLRQMLCGEFFRRILYYKLPPEAPFSKYIKLYLRRWINTYVKLQVDKNKRFVLFVDWKETKEE